MHPECVGLPRKKTNKRLNKLRESTKNECIILELSEEENFSCYINIQTVIDEFL